MRISIALLSLYVGFSINALAASVDFTKDILPVLASKCFPCHGPDPEKRKAELRLDTEDGIFSLTREGFPVVVRGDIDESEMWLKVSSPDPEERMPPSDFSKELTPDEIAAIKHWIEEGAAWERHWSFEPISSPTPPEVSKVQWVRNPIDAFVLAKLESLDMTPSDEADRRTLIRRLSFDLHGLPPTPQEVAVFVGDESADAYARLVDRLLESPRYGERWGRHWLDVVHYADTHGYDKDKRRDNAWPYRDYVINALNEDKPYARFVEEQLAGDVLYPDDPQALVATGFIAAGPWDWVGHVELREGTVDKKITRMLDRDDMVTITMAAFTSLTVNCARCHEHKFDPISQEDYYALQSVFAGVERADRIYDIDPKIHQERKRLTQSRKALQERMDTWGAKLDALSSPELDDLDEQITQAQEEIKELRSQDSPSDGYHSLVASDEITTKWVQIDLGDEIPLESIRILSALPTDYPNTPGFGFPLRFKIEASDDSDFASPRMLHDQTQSDHPARTDEPFRVDVRGVDARYIRMTATKLWKRQGDYVFAIAEMEVYSDGENVATDAAVSALDSIDSGRWHTRYLTDGFDSRRRIASSLESGETAEELKRLNVEIVALKAERKGVLRDMLSVPERDELATLETQLAEADDALSKLPKADKVYAASTEFASNGNFAATNGIREIRVLHRGDVSQPGDLAIPGAVGCVPQLASRFDLPEGHLEGERRAALARWIADVENPLTWRSIVNRVWQYHFGRGLVETPNDFGRMGAPPTHRALLDWLATEFLARGQSLKELHRLMVTSATYRQQSAHNAKHARLDSSNRFLWRMNRRQLDAEALRDTVMYISGKLDLTVGGPGFDTFVFEDDHSPRYLYNQFDPAEAKAYRRSVYRFIVRSVPDPFMTSLDCADPSQSVPVRNQTITAIQALVFLNNPMIVRHAAYLAERVEASTETKAAQLKEVYQLTLNRSPTKAELDALLPYAKTYGLPSACRIILNSNEFVFVD